MQQIPCWWDLLGFISITKDDALTAYTQQQLTMNPSMEIGAKTKIHLFACVDAIEWLKQSKEVNLLTLPSSYESGVECVMLICNPFSIYYIHTIHAFLLLRWFASIKRLSPQCASCPKNSGNLNGRRAVLMPIDFIRRMCQAFVRITNPLFHNLQRQIKDVVGRHTLFIRYDVRNI